MLKEIFKYGLDIDLSTKQLDFTELKLFEISNDITKF